MSGPQWPSLPKLAAQSPAGPPPATEAEVRALRDEIQQLRGFLSSKAMDDEYTTNVLRQARAWQDSFWDNVDAANPITRELYIPDNISDMGQAILRIRLKPFRSFSKATDVFTFGTLQTMTLSGLVYWNFAQMDLASGTSVEPSHSHSGTTDAGGADLHTHGFGTNSSGNHDHILPMHRHEIQLPNHSHNQVPGIYLGDPPTNVIVKLDGATIAGPFNTNQDAIDLRTALWGSTGWKTGWPLLEISSATVGRIECTLYMEYYVGRKAR